MDIQAYQFTNQGGRAVNEDSSVYVINDDRGIFIVADGLGGHSGGNMASSLVVNTMRSLLCDQNELSLEDCLISTNQTLLDAQKDNHNNMKSTVVALTIEGDHADWIHVGDSRLYYLTNGQISHATKDHSVTYKKFLSGEISREEINFDEDRSSLLRVVGDPTRCIPEMGGRKIVSGDAFLLCSDGLWEYLQDEEILIDRLKSETAAQWAENMLVRIQPRLSPGTDNMTLITVFVN